jgi:hypothetical protein
MRFGFRAAVIAASALTCSSIGFSQHPVAALAATSGSFTSLSNPGGGEIVSGSLGKQSSLQAAEGVMLSHIHAMFGTRPTLVQGAQNPSEHLLVLLFKETRDGQPYTGMSLITAAPGASANGVALYDISSRFPKTVQPMLKLFQTSTAAVSATPKSARLDPAEPLIQRQFPDRTGSMGVPADWTLKFGGGGSGLAIGPSGEIAAFNSAQNAMDPTYGIGLSFVGPAANPTVRTLTMKHTLMLPFISDPVKAWTTTFDQMAKQNGHTGPHFVATSVTRTGSDTATIVGTGSGNNREPINYVAYVHVTGANRIGQWGINYSYIIVPTSEVVKHGATAAAVLDSARINAQAFAAQGQAIRNAAAQQFNAEIALDKMQDAARQQRTNNAIAQDQATQEGMQKQAVAMENYSLDRAVVVNTSTGAHSTVGSNFASMLVQGNSHFQIVPPSELVRGVDF